MFSSAFLVAVVFLSCCYDVRCNVPSPCNATIECANNITVCENDFCHILAGQVCTIETTTTVATTVTTPAQTITTAGSTQPGATSQAPSSTSATTTAPLTTTAATTTSTATTTTTTPATTSKPVYGKRRKRSTGQQECVSNASCVSGQQTNKTLVCACSDGYTADNGKCNKDSGNGAGPLRVTEFFTVMVTTVLLLLI